MGFGSWMNSNVKKCSWSDISFVKLAAASSVLMIAKLWSPLLSLEWYWYGLIFVLASIKPVSTILKK